jgi:hypothetical protein
MDTDRKPGEVAANLDDISDTLEEIKGAVHEGGAPSDRVSRRRSRERRFGRSYSRKRRSLVATTRSRI